jgi:molybdate transport repressor ModE-like protein
MNIKFRVNWLHHEHGDKEHAIEPVLFELLSLIQQKGSLKQATKHAKVSYRYAWGLLNKWQEKIGKLVVLEPGRGAHLTKTGETLLNANMKMNAKLSPELENFATEIKRDLTAIQASTSSSSINIFASHGLAVSALRQLINQQSNFKLDLHFHGSLESLHALDNKQCDIAGFHIPIGPLAKPLAKQYLQVLNERNYELIYVVKRNQGLMFSRNRINDITAIQALTNKQLTFINRQANSGTRLLFDQLIKAENIKPENINGYEHEEFTHLAVAALIASGAADIGFGIAPMAKKFNLAFMPLVWEHYCLAVPKDIVQNGAVEQIKTILQSDDFKQRIADSDGYQTEQSGQAISFKTIFTH